MPFHCFIVCTFSTRQPQALNHLEGVVFWGNLSDKVIANDWNVLEDVFSDLGNFAEEVECEYPGRDAEA